MDIKNKVTVVTGAGKTDPNGRPRIGNALAMELAKQGAKVLLHYSSSREGAEKTAQDIRNAGGDAFIFQANLADENVGEKIINAAQEHFNAPVQILINSAATFPSDTIETFDPDLAIETFKIIGVGPALLMQAMAKMLPDNIQGVIINIIDAKINNRAYPDHLSYAMAKAAVSEASISIAKQLAPNIRVVRISPGAILQAAGKDIAHHREILKTIPLGHEGGTEAIAKTALSIIGNDFITGSNIVVDGGGLLT